MGRGFTPREGRLSCHQSPSSPPPTNAFHIWPTFCYTPFYIHTSPPRFSPLAAGSPPDDATKQALGLKYVLASGGQDFMPGQVLPFGVGACWGTICEATAASSPAKAAVHALDIPDVSEHGGGGGGTATAVHLFPGGAAAAAAGASASSSSLRGGSYAAVPLIGAGGAVVGLLGVDTVAESAAQHAAAPRGGLGGSGGSTMIGRQQYEYIRELAAAAGRAIARDQEALGGILLKVLYCWAQFAVHLPLLSSPRVQVSGAV